MLNHNHNFFVYIYLDNIFYQCISSAHIRYILGEDKDYNYLHAFYLDIYHKLVSGDYVFVSNMAHNEDIYPFNSIAVYLDSYGQILDHKISQHIPLNYP